MPSPLPSAPAEPAVPSPARIFEDPTSLALLRHIGRIAQSEAGVLILGDTGTGKELLARHLHQLGPRRDQPFAAVNCGAFGDALLEQELFGHEKGAFPGALCARPGAFERADGGTLLLDEVGDMPMHVQARLLRVLQEREVTRLGSHEARPIDVRVLAATNVRLEQLMNTGRFRRELFYRLNVVQLELRPLHERPGDILPLARHFIAEYSRRLDHPPARLTGEAERKLLAHPWPGNIRELENVMHHTLLMCRDGVVRAEDLHLSPLRLVQPSHRDDPGSADAQLHEAIQRLLCERRPALHATVEDTLLRSVYHHCQRNQVRTAEMLGLTRNVVRLRLERLGELVVKRRTGATS